MTQQGFDVHEALLAHARTATTHTVKELVASQHIKGGVLVVVAGAINLFSVSVSGSNEYGRRHHLARYGEGSIAVLPHKPSAEGRDLVIATEGNAEYAFIDFDTIEVISNNDIESVQKLLVESLEALSGAILSRLTKTPSDPSLLSSEMEAIFGTVKNDTTHSVLVRSKDAEFNICDLLNVTDADVAPLLPGMWVTAPQGVQLEIQDIRVPQSGAEALSKFSEFASTLLHINYCDLVEKERQDTKGISLSGELVVSSMNRSIEVLSGVISGTKQNFFRVNQNPLITATQYLCEHDFIPFESPSLNEASEQLELEEIARFNNFRTRKVILRDFWWENDHGSLLAFREDDERTPLALVKKKGRYYCYDPKTERLAPVDEETVETIAGNAFAIYRPLEDKKITVRSLISFGSKNSKRDLWVAVVVALLGALLGLVTPITMSMLIDDVIPDADKNQLLFLTIGLVAIAIADATFDITQGVASQRFSGKNTLAIQSAVWDRLLALPTTFFKEYPTGELSNRANGITQIMTILSASVMNAGLSGVFSLVYLFMLFWYSSQLAWISLGLVFATVAIAGTINYFRIRLIEQETDATNKLQTLVYSLLEALGKLRNAGVETHAFFKWSQAFAVQRPVVFKAENLANVLTTFNSVMPVFSSVIFFSTMYFFTDPSKGLSIGQFIAFTSAYASFLAAIMALTDAAVQMVATIPLYKNAKPILEAIPERGSRKATAHSLQGNIEINNLSFSYSDDGPKILSEVDLSIKSGEFVAIVGGSGSGKSTLMRLLLGFERPDDGTIFYDNADLASMDVGSMRRQLGVVLQKGQILQGDLYTNVIGSAPLSMDDAWKALALAGLKEDIEAMPMQLHTYLTPGVLSGGQIQRLLIARALVHKPSILLFDEATSALDNRSQAIVTKSLDDLRVTRIVIAHRLSTVINADRIIYLDQGKIAEQGSYDELMKMNGLFTEMASRQLV